MSIEAIKQFVVAERASSRASEDGFKALRGEAEGFQQENKTLDQWLTQCEVDESNFMEEHYGKDPKAKFKGSGKWKYRTYLPRAYYTSKKAVENAWRGNIELSNKGKTALEKESAKANRKELTFEERLAKTIRSLEACFDADSDATVKRIEEWLAKRS